MPAKLMRAPTARWRGQVTTLRHGSARRPAARGARGLGPGLALAWAFPRSDRPAGLGAWSGFSARGSRPGGQARLGAASVATRVPAKRPSCLLNLDHWWHLNLGAVDEYGVARSRSALTSPHGKRWGEGAGAARLPGLTTSDWRRLDADTAETILAAERRAWRGSRQGRGETPGYHAGSTYKGRPVCRIGIISRSNARVAPCSRRWCSFSAWRQPPPSCVSAHPRNTEHTVCFEVDFEIIIFILFWQSISTIV